MYSLNNTYVVRKRKECRIY